AVLQQKLAAAEFHPNVGLYGTLYTLSGRRTFPNPNDDVEWAAGVAAEWKLFAGGRRTAERRRAQQQLLQASRAQQLAKNFVLLEVQQAYVEYQKMSQQLPSAEAAMKDARAGIKAYQDQFAANLIPDKDMPKYFENLITARLLLSLAQVKYNQQAYGYNLALEKIKLVTAADE